MTVLFRRFEDIKAWQLANQLTLEIYKQLKQNKDFSFKDQIQRASVSIMNNIAEGFDCSSPKAFHNHLRIAKGSCGEVKSMLILGKQLEYFSESESATLIEMSSEISRLLFGLMKSLNNSN